MKGGFLQFLLVSSTSARLRLEAALSSRCRASHSPHQADTRARDLVCSRTVVLELVTNLREVSYSADLDCVELPPPEVGGKQGVVVAHGVEVVC